VETALWITGTALIFGALAWYNIRPAPAAVRFAISGLAIVVYGGILLIAFAAIVWSFFA